MPIQFYVCICKIVQKISRKIARKMTFSCTFCIFFTYLARNVQESEGPFCKSCKAWKRFPCMILQFLQDDFSLLTVYVGMFCTSRKTDLMKKNIGLHYRFLSYGQCMPDKKFVNLYVCLCVCVWISAH